MKRDVVDKVISSMGLLMTAVLLIASAALFFTASFISGEVKTQLGSQNISFPAKESAAFTSLSRESQDAIAPYAGQTMTTGAQAKVFADHYIAEHLEKIGGGKTYSELSAESMANPDDTALAGKVETVFRGEMLRGILLNAYAFGTMGLVAEFAAIGAAIAGAILLIFSLLGFSHAKKVKKRATKK